MVDGLCEKVSLFARENLDGSNIFDFLAASKVYTEYEEMQANFRKFVLTA